MVKVKSRLGGRIGGKIGFTDERLEGCEDVLADMASADGAATAEPQG